VISLKARWDCSRTLVAWTLRPREAMRWLCLLACVAVAIFGCTADPPGPGAPADSDDGSGGPGESGGGTGDPLGGTGQTDETDGMPTSGTPSTSTTGDPMESTGLTSEDAGAETSTGEPCVVDPGELGPETLPAFEAGEEIMVVFTLDGYEPEDYLSWYLGGDAPEGLTLDQGVLSGSVAEPGTHSITISVEYPDPADPSCTWNASTRSYDLEITAP
jgi:hypothetical protein